MRTIHEIQAISRLIAVAHHSNPGPSADNPISTSQTPTTLLPSPYPIPINYTRFRVSTIPVPFESRYFTDRTRSDMIEYIDRASRDVDYAESQISLAAEFARTAVSNDVNDVKNFVIKNHENQLNDAVEVVADEDGLWECVKKGEKFLELKAGRIASRVNDCIKRASNSAMDVIASTKSHLAEDKLRRIQKYNEDIKRLMFCIRSQDKQCVLEESTLIERNVESLAADAKSEVERVREARQQQISEFGVCRRFQDQSYLKLIALSDRIVETCLAKALPGGQPISW